MNYNEKITQLQKAEKPIVDEFKARAQKLGVILYRRCVRNDMTYPKEYVMLVKEFVSKFTIVGTINWAIGTLGDYRNKQAYHWLSKEWLNQIDDFYMFNEGQREYYNFLKSIDRRDDTFEGFINGIKHHEKYDAFQTLKDIVLEEDMNDFYTLTLKYPIGIVSEALIFLSKKGFKNEIVERIIADSSFGIENKEERTCNIFIFLVKKITDKRFIPFIEKIESYGIAETSSIARRLLKQKRYQKNAN